VRGRARDGPERYAAARPEFEHHPSLRCWFLGEKSQRVRETPAVELKQVTGETETRMKRGRLAEKRTGETRMKTG